MSSLRDTDHALSFNLLLYSDLFMTVNIPVLKRNSARRIVVSVENSTR